LHPYWPWMWYFLTTNLQQAEALPSLLSAYVSAQSPLRLTMLRFSRLVTDDRCLFLGKPCELASDFPRLNCLHITFTTSTSCCTSFSLPCCPSSCWTQLTFFDLSFFGFQCMSCALNKINQFSIVILLSFPFG
jgi:hypothetical protein